MRLLVGLGNPGPKYVATRHNFGFLLLDQVDQVLRSKPQYSLKQSREISGLGRWHHYSVGEDELHLLWPLTFMNLSGKALDKLLQVIKNENLCTRRDVMVLLDDLSLPLGRMRLRSKGSPGGHNGLKSIESYLGHAEYTRLKLGIGKPESSDEVVDYVLQPFSADEVAVVKTVLDYATPEVLRWLEGSSVAELSQSVNSWSCKALDLVEGPIND